MTEPTDAELDAVLCKHWPAFSMQATLVRMWVRAAMRDAIAKWDTPPAEQQVQPSPVYAELPDPAHRGPCGTGSYFDSFTRDQMRDFADRTHALRMQAAPKAAPEMEHPSREKLRDMQHYLVEAHGFAAMSPRGKENIALALEILDELETLVSFHSAPKAAPGEPVVAAVFDEQLGRPMLVKGAPLLSHGQPLYTAPQQEPSVEE